MSEIPMPGLLDPQTHREPAVGAARAGDVEESAELLDQALEEVSEYARALWEELQATRSYLFEQVAGARAGGPVVASGPMLQTEEQWAQWVTRYAAIFSVLCGPRGDEGLGESEALHEAQSHGHVLSGTPESVPPAEITY